MPWYAKRALPARGASRDGGRGDVALRSSLLKRYIAYNLIFVLLPTILLIALYTYGARRQLIRDYESSHAFALSQAMQTVDTNLGSLGVLAAQLKSDPRISPYQLRNRTYDVVEALRQLKTYTSQLGFWDDIVLYLKGSDLLYSGRGITSFDVYAGHSYAFAGDWDPAALRDLLEDGGRYAMPDGTLVRSGGTYSAVVYPWASSESSRIGSIMGIVNGDYFRDLLRPINGGVSEATFLFDADGHELFRQRSGCDLSSEQAVRLLESAPEGRSVARADAAGDCSILLATSSLNGWRYMTVLPHAQFGGQLFASNAEVYAFVGLLMLACIAIGIALAYRTYRPIRQLYIRFGAAPARAGERNELAALDALVTDMLATNDRMRHSLEENRFFASQRLLQDTLAGKAPAVAASSSPIAWAHAAYCVAAIKPRHKLSPTARERLMEGPLLAGECVYLTELVYKSYLAALINLPGPAQRTSYAERIADELRRAHGIDAALGVGGVCASLSEVNSSLTEAVIALESGPRGGIAYYEPPSGPQDPAGTIQGLHLRLTEWLRQGNMAKAEETLDRIEETLRAMAEDAVMIRFVAGALAFSLLPLAQEAGIADAGARVSAFARHTDVDAFQGELRALCADILASLARQAQSRHDDQYGRILRYIDDHYASFDISLTSIAEMFDMTTSYLSRFFRERNGSNFIDYLTRKRMEEACRLLCTEDCMVRDVMSRVGYIDIASFTRKFKQVVGMSPGRYRDQHRAG